MGWGTSNGLVIDLAGMNRVTIDAAKHTGRFDAGVLGGEVMRVAGRYGLAPVFGECPGVGASGLTLWRPGLAFRTLWSGLRQSAFRSYRNCGRPDSVC